MAEATAQPSRLRVTIRGAVQGVGFRPTVWRLACDEGLVGEVLNDTLGVLIRTTGTDDAITRFLQRLTSEAPPLSQIEDVQTQHFPAVLDFEEFRIVESVAGENRTRVTPDAAVCAACRAEVLDPAERRFGMVFQHYALFPHLTVEENVAFGLAGRAPDARDTRVREVLEMVDLAGFERRGRLAIDTVLLEGLEDGSGFRQPPLDILLGE